MVGVTHFLCLSVSLNALIDGKVWSVAFTVTLSKRDCVVSFIVAYHCAFIDYYNIMP